MERAYDIKLYPDMGRGLESRRPIVRGESIARCEVLVLSPRDTDIVNTTDLKYYLFRYNETQDCLVLGDGELFNHAPDANVGYRLVWAGDRRIMEFVALRDIPAGSQLFINYSADVSVNVNAYIGAGSLVG